MTRKYILQIDSRGKKAEFLLIYKNEKIFRIERKNGYLLDEQWLKLNKIVPQSHEALKAFFKAGYFESGISLQEIELDKPVSLYSQMVGAFLSFYEKQNKIPYSFSAIDGKNIKWIDQKLAKICTSEAEILATWETILGHWDKLEPFYKKQMTLKQINGNLNDLLRQIKHGNESSKSKAKRTADDIRTSFKKPTH